MAIYSDKIPPFGRLDTENDPTRVGPGNYTDANNIEHLTDAGGTTQAVTNIKGNDYAFAIEPTVAQNKIYQITIGDDGATSHDLDFYYADGPLYATATFTEGANFAATSANIQAAVNAALPALTFSYSQMGSVFTLEVTNIPAYDYTLISDNFAEVTILQEAIDVSLEGEANIIGSFDLNGDLFVWSTPQTEMPDEMGAISTSNTTPIVATFTAHGLTDGQSVKIVGVTGNTAANGSWIINVLTANTFELLTSVGNGVDTGGGQLWVNIYGVGEIGVATFNPNSVVSYSTASGWTYTTLIKSKQFKFRRQKQVDTYCESNNFQKSLYWTDDYNPPRCLYYSGAYSADGAIEAINPDGKYDYITLLDETQLILSNENIGFTFTEQLPSGGQVESGNWRYSIRLLTSGLSATNWLPISNPINVYLAAPSGSPGAIGGDLAGVTTAKVNKFEVTDIPFGAFTYLELAAINYVNGAIFGYIVKRVLLNGPDLTIEHTGTEINAVNLDLATLNQFSFDIQTAKNIAVVDNRMILSNLTTGSSIDFSAWTATWEHSILRDTILPIGNAIGNPTLNAQGEYQNPVNVYSKVGYMHNDTYRFGARFKLKNGSFTNVFWIDDITINTSATNVTTPDRRVAGLADYNLTGAGIYPDVYVPYVQFSNIDLDFLIDNIPVREYIEAIHFERAERVKEVLFTGAMARTVTGVSDPGPTSLMYGVGGVEYGEYPFISGRLGLAATGYSAYPGVAPYNFAVDATTARIVKFYAPDVFFGLTSVVYAAGDSIYNYGQPFPTDFRQNTTYTWTSQYVEYNGNYTHTLNSISLDDSEMMNDGGAVSIASINYTTSLQSQNVPVAGWIGRGGVVCYAASAVTTSGAYLDYGLYYGQYFRAIAYTDPSDPSSCKYGNPAETTYIPTGAILVIDGTVTSPTSCNVFGGDALTQKTYIKHRAADGTAGQMGGAGGLAFYSQNVVNSQMIIRYGNGNGAWDYPNTTLAGWFDPPGELGPQNAPYNTGYTITNGISRDAGFDVNSPAQSDLPTQMRWSDVKAENSIIDGYRVFLPLNFHDLNLSDGEIMWHGNYNGELFSLQPRRNQRQFFNTRGILQVGGSATGAVIGDGSVMSRDGVTISLFGTKHKWSVLKGKTRGGNDVIAWINTEMKKVCRMGPNGTIVISDEKDMRSFFANNLTWVDDNDTPADGTGICGVWDTRFSKYIWTVRGHKDVPTWDTHDTYEVGNEVFYQPSTYSTFEQTGEIYVSLTNGNSANQPDTSPTNWQLIAHTDNNYYNEYTITYSEAKDGFADFRTPKPKIYLQWKDVYLSARPISDTGEVYEHDKGNYGEWYNDGSTSQLGDSDITPVYNRNDTDIKRIRAVDVVSEIVPERMTFNTDQHETYIESANFEARFNAYVSSVRNDLLTSSNGIANDEDSSRVFGNYVKVKFTMLQGVFQKLVNIVVKFSILNRNYKK